MTTVPYLPIDGEIWRPVPGFDSRYEASSEGRLRRVKGKRSGEKLPRIICPFPGDGGYVRVVVIREDGRQFKPGIHQLVALAFYGPCPAGLEIDHKDLDKTNNRPGNLEYITHEENIRRSFSSGKRNIAKGERSGNAKLTDASVRAIRHDTRPQRVVAAEHGISGVAVCLIRQRKSWKHVED